MTYQAFFIALTLLLIILAIEIVWLHILLTPEPRGKRKKEAVKSDYLRAVMSTWFTIAAMDSHEPDISDILTIRDWIDGGCIGTMPEPTRKVSSIA